MAIRNIIKLGDETLRKKSRKVDVINDRIKTLISDMADTLHSTDDGIGLAAPQVGVLRRVVVIDMGDGVKAYINPEIVSSQGSRKAVESCLSIPGRSATVIRPEKVTVKAMDEDGKEFTEEAQWLRAVCLCHEIDHLDGILFIDKAID
ncbi:peptide deformylase [[Clostridium] cellulosi]|uniref:Peptide deformylase n=1 Tax=[Clostridium] cellulosi TaxID=29343 RepID=A0A078KQY2_9FIRM|nr:peptide deformylase [[Clostridium] cellulosi]